MLLGLGPVQQKLQAQAQQRVREQLVRERREQQELRVQPEVRER